MRLSLDQLLSSIFSDQKGKIILFKNDEIYNNLSPKGKLAYLRDIQNGYQVDPDEFNDVKQLYVEPEEMYNLVKIIVQLTDDQNNTEKVLQYIDKQSSPKSIPRVVQDLCQILKTDITDSDGRWILSCVMARSDDYCQKVVQLVAS